MICSVVALIGCGDSGVSGDSHYSEDGLTQIKVCTSQSDCESIEGWASGGCVGGECIVSGCQENYHVCRESDCSGLCERNAIFHCGEHGRRCADFVEGWVTGSCEHGQCFASQCAANMHPVISTGVCEYDSVQNCGQTGFNCLEIHPNWSEASCVQAQCVATGCKPEYQLASGDCVKTGEQPTPPPAVNCPSGQHPYGSGCEDDSVQNCGQTGFNCLDVHPTWLEASCVQAQCVATGCKPEYQLASGDCVKNEDPATPPPVANCPSGEHPYGSSCEPDSLAHCGEHGHACGQAQICDPVLGCQDRPCTYLPKNSRSPAICAEENGYALFCGSDNIYYLANSGKCTSSNPCVTCPDGFGGCSNDSEAFCKNHQKPSDPSTPTNLPETCVKNAYPPICENNTGYLCGDKSTYYSSANTRCSAEQSCVICNDGYIGCSHDPTAFCSERNGIHFPIHCTKGHRRCNGTKLVECDGESYSKTVETCPSWCSDGYDGTNSSCSYYQPACTLKNGTVASIVVWNDGDTAYVYPSAEDGSCDNTDGLYDLWLQIRIKGIDTPECTKKQNSNYYKKQTCVVDTNYKSTNDPYGYDAWQKAMELIPPNTTVTISCDEPDEYNNCPLDANGRALVYLSANEKDFGSEMIKAGLAMPNLSKLPYLNANERAICEGLKTAISARENIYSVCTSGGSACVSQAASALPSSKPGEFALMYDRCQYVLWGTKTE